VSHAAISVEIGSASSEWGKKDDDWAPLVSERPGTGAWSLSFVPSLRGEDGNSSHVAHT
jgi:hypothetical protein